MIVPYNICTSAIPGGRSSTPALLPWMASMQPIQEQLAVPAGDGRAGKYQIHVFSVLWKPLA